MNKSSNDQSLSGDGKAAKRCVTHLGRSLLRLLPAIIIIIIMIVCLARDLKNIIAAGMNLNARQFELTIFGGMFLF